MASATGQSRTVRISHVERSQLDSIADAHRKAFPESFLTALGTGAITRYYLWQLEGPHDSVAVAADVDGKLAGFCFAGVFRGAMSGFLRKNRAYLAVRVLLRGGLIWNPEFRSRIAKGLRLLLRPARRKRTAAGVKVEAFGILSLAVAPSFQGLGVGKQLMDTCERIARERGFAEMELVVAPANGQAVRFYEKAGWMPVQLAGEWDGRMRKVIA
jgi:ribosomal protein S18 acetylase RimI-like enzyme